MTIKVATGESYKLALFIEIAFGVGGVGLAGVYRIPPEVKRNQGFHDLSIGIYSFIISNVIRYS
jgi:hypothetical protein